MINEIRLCTADNTASVKIIDGELVSFQKFGQEFIHQKGDKGWGSSDAEMFPIIGPTDLNNYSVSTPKGACFQEKHGILRLLDYKVLEITENTAIFQKIYIKNTKVLNAKYPVLSSLKEVFWTYDFTFNKKYTLNDGVLTVEFELLSDIGMPFMLGYHPAFKIFEKKTAHIDVDAEKVTIDAILEKGGDAYPVLNRNKITFFTNKLYAVDITTKGFENFMFWTEVENMICLEPITQYPDLERQQYSEMNMRISTGKNLFTVEIRPFEV